MRRRWAGLGLAAALAVAGCGSSGHHAATPPASTVAPSSTSAAPTTATTSAPPATTPAPPAGGPVPAGLQTQSASFISAEQGWVLGTAPCSQAPCTSIARTTDATAHWAGVPAPKDALSNGEGSAQSGVSGIRFADSSNGWVYGPDLWSTHDGGSTWTRVSIGAAVSQVVDLEAAGGEVDAVVTGCAVDSSGCPGQLWHAPVGSDHFTQVANVSIPDGRAAIGPSHLLSLHASTGYLVSSTGNATPSTVWVTTNGTTWASHPVACPGGDSLDAIAPVTAAQAFGLCSGAGAAGSMAKAVVVTDNAGASFSTVGQPPPFGGDAGTIVAATSSTLVIAAASGASELYRSVNGGAIWATPLQLADGGVGFADIGFTTATRGFAVHAPAALVDGQAGEAAGSGPDPATLYVTSDGGTTWAPAAISSP